MLQDDRFALQTHHTHPKYEAVKIFLCDIFKENLRNKRERERTKWKINYRWPTKLVYTRMKSVFERKGDAYALTTTQRVFACWSERDTCVGNIVTYVYIISWSVERNTNTLILNTFSAQNLLTLHNTTAHTEPNKPIWIQLTIK